MKREMTEISIKNNVPEQAVMGTAEAGKELGLKKETVSQYCRMGKLQGAYQYAKGSPWQIPIKTIEMEKRKRGLK